MTKRETKRDHSQVRVLQALEGFRRRGDVVQTFSGPTS